MAASAYSGLSYLVPPKATFVDHAVYEFSQEEMLPEQNDSMEDNEDKVRVQPV